MDYTDDEMVTIADLIAEVEAQPRPHPRKAAELYADHFDRVQEEYDRARAELATDETPAFLSRAQMRTRSAMRKAIGAAAEKRRR